MAKSGRIYMLTRLTESKDRYYGYTVEQSKQVHGEYLVVTSANSEKSNTAIILTGHRKGCMYFFHNDDLVASTLSQSDFQDDDKKFFDGYYYDKENGKDNETMVSLLKNNKVLTINQNY